ncbi:MULTISPECIES: GIY-YIG nuclease family protein [unclassified Saccharothrix]|uniref:GIY-YIG nuclease family protein n=1 Tax=unclassified Saccharothrix TaxID=2593673 RepID=UPI00307E0FAF
MPHKPHKKDLPAESVRQFLDLLEKALTTKDDQGRVWADAQWGCYAFYDYDGEPIYVGQTNERLRARVRRHLSNQRTDAVAMRILDVFEVAEMELWPLWEFEGTSTKDPAARKRLNEVEHTAYMRAVDRSRFKAILNEKIPPVTGSLAEMPTSKRFSLISDETKRERGHPDIRIARRAETISRLAAVAHERGEVSDGLRRVLVVQAARLAHLAASRLAETRGAKAPGAEAINLRLLVGDVHKPQSAADVDQPEGDSLELDFGSQD